MGNDLISVKFLNSRQKDVSFGISWSLSASPGWLNVHQTSFSALTCLFMQTPRNSKLFDSIGLDLNPFCVSFRHQLELIVAGGEAIVDEAPE